MSELEARTHPEVMVPETMPVGVAAATEVLETEATEA
jgi:hypothetical protein